MAAATALVGLAASACGLSASGSTPSLPTSTVPIDLDVFITNVIGAPPSRQKLMDDMVSRHPGIKLNLTEIGGSADADRKLLTAAAAGSVPDVFYQHEANMGTFVAAGIPRELDSLATRDKKLIDLGDFNPGASLTYTWQGKLYGLCHQYEPNVLYYNKNSLQSAGLQDPIELDRRGMWTLAKFEEYLKALTRGAGESARYGMTDIGNGTNLREQSFWLWGYNGDIFSKDGKECTFNTPDALKAWDSLTGYRIKEWVPSTEVVASWNLPAFGTLRDGKVAFRNSNRGLAYQLADSPGGSYGTVPIPIMPNGKQTCRAGGNSYAVAQASKKVDGAWQVCAYLATRGADVLTAEGALFPNRKSVMKRDIWLKQLLPWEDAKVYEKVAGTVRTLFTPPGGLRIDPLTAEAYRKVVNREASAVVAFDDAKRRGDAILREYIK